MRKLEISNIATSLRRAGRPAGLLTSLALAAIALAACGDDEDENSGPRQEKLRSTELRFIAPDTEQGNVEAGKEGPSQGDLFLFQGPLNDTSGKRVGRLSGHCVTVSTPTQTREHRQQCFMTINVGSGETEIQAQGVGRIKAEDVLFSITGGTMRYKRARGEALFDYRQRGRVALTLRLES